MEASFLMHPKHIMHALVNKKKMIADECIEQEPLVEKPSFVGRPISTIVPDAIKTGAKDQMIFSPGSKG